MGFFKRMIQPDFDRHFFQSVPDAVEEAFAAAHWRARSDDRYLGAQMPNAEGNDRYYLVQREVMRAAVQHGAEDVTARVGGFPLPIARHRRFLVTTSITDSLQNLRRSRGRAALAKLNAHMEAVQPDFFNTPEILREDYHFGMIIVSRRRGQTGPAGIYFGVPTSSLRSWHFYHSIDDVVKMYDDPMREVAQRPGPRLRSVARSRAGRRNKKK